MTVFSKQSREKILNADNQAFYEASKKIASIPKDFIIRNHEDSVISMILNNKNLNVFKSEHPLVQYLMDLRDAGENSIERIGVFDFETTDKYNAYGVSMAVVILNIKTGLIEDEFYSLIKTDEPIHPEAQSVHGISKEMLEDQPDFKTLLPKMKTILDKADIYSGFNLAFDLKVFDREMEKIGENNFLAGQPYLDSMNLSKDIVKALNVKGQIKNPRLEESISYFGIELEDTGYHNALVDTKAAAELIKVLLNLEPDRVKNLVK